MDTRPTSATVPESTEPIIVNNGGTLHDVSVVKARESGELAIPNASALSALNRSITRLAQQLMDAAHEHSEDGSTLRKTEALLVEARHQLAAIRARSMANPRVRASLEGARTGLLTAAREARAHLIRHGSAVDEIGE